MNYLKLDCTKDTKKLPLVIVHGLFGNNKNFLPFMKKYQDYSMFIN